MEDKVDQLLAISRTMLMVKGVILAVVVISLFLIAKFVMRTSDTLLAVKEWAKLARDQSQMVKQHTQEIHAAADIAAEKSVVAARKTDEIKEAVNNVPAKVVEEIIRTAEA